MRDIIKKADLVFQGGGVLAIAFAGVFESLEKNNYKIQRTAGASAGAIAASLIASGYDSRELKKVLFDTSLFKFNKKAFLNYIPIFGNVLSLVFTNGIYSPDYIETWMEELLSKKGIYTFKDLKYENGYRVKIMVSDITRKKLVIIPDHLAEYGINADDFSVAKAVKMSSCIPFYFKPCILNYNNTVSCMVDGGLLSNFPIWIFDVKSTPRWPTFGFKFEKQASYCNVDNFYLKDYSIDIVSTTINKNEELFIRNEDLVRTISIDSMGVKAVDFDISKERKDNLINEGFNSCENFLSNWNFHNYVETFRK